MRGECHPPDSGRPIVVVALGLRLVLVPFVRRRFADDPYRRYWSGKVASYAIVAVAVIAIVALWAPLGGRLSVILGFATAGIAFAMQEVIGALFGWVNILAGRIYTVGDRIEIAGVRGDVADITPPGIEHPAGSAPANRPGEWSRCQTGRPSPTPCSTSLRTWTGSGRRSCYACHKTPTGLARSGSSTRRSAGTRRREQGEAALAQLGERYLVSRAEVEPQTYIRVAEGDIEIVGASWSRCAARAKPRTRFFAVPSSASSRPATCPLIIEFSLVADTEVAGTDRCQADRASSASRHSRDERRLCGQSDLMYIGTSIFLIALGAILKYAVTFTVAGISIQTVGLILMIVGVVGLVASLLYPLADRRRHDRRTGQRGARRARP